MSNFIMYWSILSMAMSITYGIATNFEDQRKRDTTWGAIWQGLLHYYLWPLYWGRLALRSSVARRNRKRELFQKQKDAELEQKALKAHDEYIWSLEIWDQDKRTFKPERVTLSKEHRLQHQDWQGDFDRADRPHREKREAEMRQRAAEESRQKARAKLTECRKDEAWEMRTDLLERGEILFHIGAKELYAELTRDEADDLDAYLQHRRYEQSYYSWQTHRNW